MTAQQPRFARPWLALSCGSLLLAASLQGCMTPPPAPAAVPNLPPLPAHLAHPAEKLKALPSQTSWR